MLVTHGISFLPQADFIIVLANGQVSEMGHYSALLQHDGSFANFLRNYAPDEGQEDHEGGKKLIPTIPGLPNPHSSSPSIYLIWGFQVSLGWPTVVLGTLFWETGAMCVVGEPDALRSYLLPSNCISSTGLRAYFPMCL